MTKIQQLHVQFNQIIDFSSIEKHPNYNNLKEDGQRCFNISDQEEPSKEQLCQAKKMRNIESPNIQLKEIQNKHTSIQTALNNFKEQINTVNNCYNPIQLTYSVVHLFEKLTQMISQ
ncbi:Hypothetical_protein [Hexamita inflata]|uniref:Hypothetical_protein n=1 Tax=Hexamita inflata TaxID=28002 RepID=A0AA86RLC2_9EUKA|nr:Hypothetical protein HINF_LOCUS66462 [Hexamita inflata]